MMNKSVFQVSVSETGSLVKDSSVILEIPPATTIAYGVIELFIKHNGQFGEWKAHFLWHAVQLWAKLFVRQWFLCLPVHEGDYVVWSPLPW